MTSRRSVEPEHMQLKATQAFNHRGLGGVGLEGVEVLVGLGLSGRQARVYLALLKARDAKARMVADLTLIDRQEVYRVLDSLQQLGLVQQNITVPTSYIATPIDETIRLLLEQKTGEIKFITQKANRLIKKLSQTPRLPQAPITLKPSFGTVTERDGGKKYQKAVEETQQTIEVVTSWPRFRKLCFLLETQLKGVLKNGIALNIVTEKPQNHNLPRWVKTATLRYPNFKLKILPCPPKAAVITFDQAQTAIAFNINSSLTKGATLWTTNPHLIAVCHAYFKEVWAQTQN